MNLLKIWVKDRETKAGRQSLAHPHRLQAEDKS